MRKWNLILYGLYFTCLIASAIACKDHHRKVMQDEISDKLLDSLAAYPQLSIQCDLNYKLFLEKYPNTHDAYWCRSIPYNKTGQHAIGFAMLNKAVE